MAAVIRVMRSGCFILGPEVRRFEEDLAAYLGTAQAVAVNSGTDALVIALRACGVGPGDEVLTTPFTFGATAQGICLVGARPVFADIDPRTFNLDAARLEESVTPRTRAIVPVHLFGQAADMDPILEVARRYGLKVVEDAAQALGAAYRGRRVGTLGHAGCLSFYPSKNLGAMGDGGAIVSDAPGVAQQARRLRNHGLIAPYVHEAVGHNSRLDELQAAVLRAKLPGLDAANEARRVAARRYDELLTGVAGVSTPYVANYGTHVYSCYTVRIGQGRRDKALAALRDAGIDCRVFYPVPLHRQIPYASRQELTEAERASLEVLSLPLWPHMPHRVQERVCAVLTRAVAQRRVRKVERQGCQDGRDVRVGQESLKRA